MKHSAEHDPGHAISASGAALRLAALLALACSGWLAVVWSQGTGFPIWLAGQAIILVAGTTAVGIGARSGIDLSPSILVLFSTLVLGAAGALLAGIAVLADRRTRISATILDAWYDRISLAGDVDHVTRLATAVSMGRAVMTDTATTSDFERIVVEGTTAERQTALGLIARQFAPAYAPALKSALVSPEPVIRVQAAAVAVKVKADLSSVLAVLAASSAPFEPLKAAEAAAELQAMVATGLLDDDDRSRALDAAAVFTRAAVGDLDIEAFKSATPAARDVVESELLRQRRFADFRALRARALASAPGDPSPDASSPTDHGQ